MRLFASDGQSYFEQISQQANDRGTSNKEGEAATGDNDQ